MTNWLSAARSRAASEVRLRKNTLTKRRRYPNSSPTHRRAFQRFPKEVDDGVHAPLIADKASDGNLP